MAYPCIACPQDWNVPDNFESLPQHEKDLYFAAWAIDGNFKAEHTTSRRPRNNVQIFPGSGFFPDPEDFAKHTKKPCTDKTLPPEAVRLDVYFLLNPRLTVLTEDKLRLMQ